MLSSREKMKRRASRVRHKLRKTAGGKPRLTVFRSHKNIYAQVIDDLDGRTLAAASTLDKDYAQAAAGKSSGDVEAAKWVGQALAERAKKAGVSEVVFDRGGYIYHGRIKALADAAREAGLEF